MGKDFDAREGGYAPHHGDKHFLFGVLEEELLETAAADEVVIGPGGDFESRMLHVEVLSVRLRQSSHNSPRLATTNNLEFNNIEMGLWGREGWDMMGGGKIGEK